MRDQRKLLRGGKLCLSVLAGSCGSLYGAAALAQQSNAGDRAQLEEVVVTGSRVRAVSGMSAPTPVTAVTPQELSMFNPGSTIAEELDALPQFFQTQTAQRGGVTFIDAGGSYLNLRGMGANRTLVLLDGSRIVPADSFGSVNIDDFPTALLQRVDIVTGGASAAYGADAVAGVVNFVLNREFEGLKGSASWGTSERGGNQNYNFSIAGGTAITERLHFIGSAQARHVDEIDPDSQRPDNWQDWGQVRNPEWSPSDPPGTHPQRITVPHVFGALSSPQGLIMTPGFSLTGYTFTDDGKGVRPYLYGDDASTSGPGSQNNQSGGPEYDYYDRATTRGPDGNQVQQRSAFAALKYDVTDRLSLRGQFIFGRTESNSFDNRGNAVIDSPSYRFTLYLDNPYLPQTVKDAMTAADLTSISVAKRGQIHEPGMINLYDHRNDVNSSQLESETVGFDFDINDKWTLTANYEHGVSDVDSAAQNIPRIDKNYLAIDAVPGPNGEPICNITKVNPTPAQLAAFMQGKLLPSPLSLTGVPADSPIGPLDPADCVPLNILGLGNSSQAAVDWIEDHEKKNVRSLEQSFTELLATGQIDKSWGGGPLSIAAGATYRDESFTQYNVPTFGERGVLNAPALGIRGISIGFVGPGNRSLHPFTAIGSGGGGYRVSEVYSELNLPVWKGAGGRSLGTSFAFRSSDYSTSGRQDSWKIGADMQITRDLRWRATQSHDVREPNFSEQYVAGSGGGFVNDPLLNQANGALTVVSGPNQNLHTEEADTLTTGFVYQPRFAPWAEGMQVSLDWYDIDLSSAVARYGAQRLVDDCFATGDAHICSLVQRDPNTQIIQRVIDEYVNVGGAKTTGVDLEVQYAKAPDFLKNMNEQFTLRMLAGYLGENSTTSAAGTKVDDVNSRERPSVTANVTASYDFGPYGLRLQQRYYGSTLNNVLWVEGVDIDDNTISSQSITNLAFSYGHNGQGGKDWRLTLSVTNLFDRDPPIIAGAGGQAVSYSFDQFGRRYQLGLNMNF
ncbi:MAG TPA: TonB-dependent receptor [Gammaproteobacteria bacterium]|nr:TonB-dependent receptor [Gammaproteobacteria bacterium]